MKSEQGSITVVTAAVIGMAWSSRWASPMSRRRWSRALMLSRRPTPPRSPQPRSWRSPPGGVPPRLAGDLAARNGAALTACACAAGTAEALVKVQVPVGALLLLPGASNVTARARAVVDLPGQP